MHRVYGLGYQIRYPTSTLFLFSFGVSSLKLNNKRTGTLIMKGLLGEFCDGTIKTTLSFF